MDKKKLITKIIFGDENLENVYFPVNEDVKQNFEIAWDVEKYLRDVKYEIRKLLAKEILKISRDVFSENFEVIDNSFTTGEKEGYISIFPTIWILEGNEEPLFNYYITFEGKDFKFAYYGIEKLSANLPYKGEIPKEFDFLSELQKELLKIGFEKSKYSLVWKYFDSPYKEVDKKEIYEIILEKGFEKCALYYVNTLKDLIEETKEELDEFIEEYKENNA